MRPTPDNQIRRKLARTARLIRLFAIARAVLVFFALMELALWASVGLDYVFVLSKEMRAFLLAITFGIASAVTVRTLRRQIFRPMSWSELAAIYERRVPELNESLLTAVTDTQRGWNRDKHPSENDLSESAHKDFLDHTTWFAARMLANVRITSLFNWTNMAALAGGVILLAALTVTICIGHSDLALLISRAVCVTDERLPSRTILFLEGTNQQNEFFVRQGDPFELRIITRVLRGQAVREMRLLMSQEGESSDHTEVLRCRQFREETVNESERKSGEQDKTVTRRVFTVNFATVLSSMKLVIRGGDAECVCRVHVIKPLTVVSANVRQTFPDYIQRKTTIEAVNAVHCVPEGTSLVFEFECDTPLGTIALRPESAAKVQRLAGQEKRFTIMSQALHRVLRFDLYLEDQNGIAPREPLGVHIEIVPDRAPTVKATTPGTGRRITPFARIPYTVSVADDYGINSLFLDMRKGNGSSWGSWESMRLTTLWPPAMEYETQGVFDAALLPLKPGDMLSLRPTATDYKPIQDGRGERFQTGTGPVRDFEIVDPAQLKESLEVEEYGYRDRLVNLIRQTQQTKDMMSGTMGVSKDQAIPWSRVLRDLQKEMFDATQIALGITGLCEEIRNNRLCQSPEHSLDSIALSRIQKAGQSLYLPGHLEELQSQVVVPLESLVEKEFVLLCKRVTSASTGTDTLKPAGQKEIIGSTEKIILELNNVLAHMRSLQSFRELVDEFRVIRNDLEHSRRTTDQRKDALFHELEK